jgi:Ca2+-binding EF-hand superfamily protein
LSQILQDVPLISIPPSQILSILFTNPGNNGAQPYKLDFARFTNALYSILPRIMGAQASTINPKLLEQLFEILDTNHDGLVDVAEFGEGLQKFYELESDEFRNEKKLWSVISKADWIP